VRVRSGDSHASFGNLTAVTSSPLELEKQLLPNPSKLLEVELTLESQDKAISPVVRDLRVEFTCSPKLK
jgi:hypothetical protein